MVPDVCDKVEYEGERWRVSILLPRMKVFALLETFFPVFEYLQNAGVVAKSGELWNFRILDEDNLTLSYIFSEKN